MNNIVEHPSHYCDGRKFEPKDVIRDWDLNFNLGNAVKYISRAGRKDDMIQDLKKAKQYLEFEISYLEKEKYTEMAIQANERLIKKHEEAMRKLVVSLDDDMK